MVEQNKIAYLCGQYVQVGIAVSLALKTASYQALKIGFSGPSGRGVLRFSGQAYRNSVHILAIFAYFSQNGSF